MEDIEKIFEKHGIIKWFQEPISDVDATINNIPFDMEDDFFTAILEICEVDKIA